MDVFPLRTPAPDLAFQIAARLTEIGEPHRGRVDGVQVCQHLDQRVDAGVDDVLVPHRLELGPAAHHLPRNVFDHLERGTEHRVVVAQRDCAGHRNVGVSQPGDHGVLPRHVVRGWRQPVQRRAAQHPFRRVVGDQKGQVGAAPGDQLSPSTPRRGAPRPIANACPTRRGRARQESRLLFIRSDLGDSTPIARQ